MVREIVSRASGESAASSYLRNEPNFPAVSDVALSSGREFVDIDFLSTRTAAIRGCVVILVDGTTDLLRWVIKVVAPGCRGEIIEAKCLDQRSSRIHTGRRYWYLYVCRSTL